MVQLQADVDVLKDLGFQIIAACIDPPEKLADSAQKWGVKFPLLSDPQLELAHAYGVAYRPPGKGGLPVPAVFLIDGDGVIQYQYVNPIYKVRLARDVLFAAARVMSPSTE
ncbi:MAG: redoxin domain-containing protein [Gemmatimonadetes bacterium]|nr:redoxin domain-containing protein [Gemmatimonadota bacterium]MBT7859050.1 redoxin domain-containing protein [Gemmatimonadota bacterium]